MPIRAFTTSIKDVHTFLQDGCSGVAYYFEQKVMTLSSKGFRLIEYRAGSARVLTPAEPLTHTFIVDRTGDNDFFIFSNRQDLQKLGWLWSVAARCRGSLIYLPTRKNLLSPYLKALV